MTLILKYSSKLTKNAFIFPYGLLNHFTKRKKDKRINVFLLYAFEIVYYGKNHKIVFGLILQHFILFFLTYNFLIYIFLSN